MGNFAKRECLDNGKARCLAHNALAATLLVTFSTDSEAMDIGVDRCEQLVGGGDEHGTVSEKIITDVA